MFGNHKTPAPSAADAAADAKVKEGGKGRPTPTRREAEQRNRRPLVGAPPPPKGATRAERKAARAVRQQAVREERKQTRLALASGDERHLPLRDKGPARRFARDYVDARRNIGEYFLPMAVISIAIQVINVPIAKLISLALLYLMVIAIAIDSFLLRRRIQALTNAKFGEKVASGTGTYALMRALQLRRGRMPKPQVERGRFPS